MLASRFLCAVVLSGVGASLVGGDSAPAAELPEANGEVILEAQPWPQRPGPRQITAYLHYPGGKLQNVTAETGLMLTLHNWGGTRCVGTADPQVLAEQLNVVAVCVDYLQSGKQAAVEDPEPYDFGYLQALDALRALHCVFDGLTQQGVPFASDRIFATGGSGGGNVTLMANKLAPRTFTCIIDMCGMARLSDDIAFNHPGGSSLNARYSSNPLSADFLSPDAQELRFIGNPWHLAAQKQRGATTKIIVVHGTTDATCPIEDAREMVANMQATGLDVEPHFLQEQDLDGKVFTSTGHPLGNRTEIVLKVAGDYLRPDSPRRLRRPGPTDFERRDAIHYPTSGGEFVISYAQGFPVGTFIPQPRQLELSAEVRERALLILRDALRGDEFWPAMHAAEGLTLAGHGTQVIEFLEPKLPLEQDDQRRCGLARELVRAGQRDRAAIMLAMLASENPHGHIHAAESLYKVDVIGDGNALRQAFERADNIKLKIMSAAALARCGDLKSLAWLREQLAADDQETMQLAAWVLGRIGDRSDCPQLRKNLARAAQPIIRAYQEHALAMLGDEEGLAALRKNLTDADPLIRTYAANFAGDARALSVAEDLQPLLEDENLDARVRAAQALLFLAQPAPLSAGDDVSVLAYETSAAHPRLTEGSIIELSDGSLLYATTQFAGDGSDFAAARIVARQSQDGGQTWGPIRVLQESTGRLNVMSVTLRRLAPPAPAGTLAMFYLEKNAFDNLQVFVKFSHDEGATFGDAVPVTTEPGYHVLNNDRITQLSTGRLLAPVATTADVQKVNHFVSLCWLSDDGGQTWRKAAGAVDQPQRGAMEPEVIELRDGRVLMIMRTQMGCIATAHSSDGGETWNEQGQLDLKAPEAPATLRRIPATGDLLLIWNNTFQAGAGHGGARTPLTAAISSDEGQIGRAHV